MKSIILQPRQVRRLQEHGSCQARFPVDPQPKHVKTLESERLAVRKDPVFGDTVLTFDGGSLPHIMQAAVWITKSFGTIPYEPGEILFVQEEVSWGGACHYGDGLARVLCVYSDDHRQHIRTTGEESTKLKVKTAYKPCPASSMPSWASRFEVRVKRLWAEMLREIGFEDIAAEGIYPASETWGHDGGVQYREDFGTVWDEENPQHPFDSELWVWVPELELEGRRS